MQNLLLPLKVVQDVTFVLFLPLLLLHYRTKGAFNNYVDKMRGGGDQKYMFLSPLRV